MRRRAALALVIAVGACGSKPPPATGPRRPVAPLSTDAYSHYLRGRIAMIEGDYAGAVRQFRAASSAAPDESPIFVAYFEALFRAGHREEALRQAAVAQERWKDAPEVWLASGKIYRATGRNRQAVGAYQRAVELAPDDEGGYLGLARTHLALRKPGEAEKVYRELVRAVEDSVAGHFRLGRRLIARDAHRDAETHLRRVLELEPDHIKARVELARVLRATGRKAESIDTLQSAFDRSGGDPWVGEQLFVQLLEAGDRGDAVALLELLDRDDLSARSRISLGYLYLQIGETRGAIAIADAVLARHPVSGEAVLLKARALADARRADEAVPLLLDIAAERPAFATSRAYAAELLARAGDTRRARAVVEEALAQHPGHVGLIVAQALVHERGGDVARAREILRAALAAKPGDADLLYAWADIEDRAGNPARAVELVERVLAANPDDPHALNFIGYSLADRNVDLDRAERMLVRAIELAPGNGYVLDSYGWLLFRRNRLDEAEDVLARASRLAPTEPEILWHLGELYLARKERRRALQLLEKARSFGPDGRVRDRIEARIQALRERK